jgi:hypothetical protein
MISMNWRPPRAIAVSSAAMFPAAKARTRKSESRNMGSATRASATQKSTSSATPPARPASTSGFVQPVALPP